MPRFNYFARQAAATLLRMAEATQNPAVAAGLVQRAADLKDLTSEPGPGELEAPERGSKIIEPN